MIRETGLFTLKLACFSLVLFLAHYYILSQFHYGKLYFPLWAIYSFHALLVFAIYNVLKFYSKKKSKDMLKIFLVLTTLKMLLSILFLLPLFLNKSDHTQLEVFNFFIPYFIFLIIEIMGLNGFLQKS